MIKQANTRESKCLHAKCARIASQYTKQRGVVGVTLVVYGKHASRKHVQHTSNNLYNLYNL